MRGKTVIYNRRQISVSAGACRAPANQGEGFHAARHLHCFEASCLPNAHRARTRSMMRTAKPAGGASDVLGLFGDRTLPLIQEVISRITGLSLFVLDASGTPVLEQGASSTLCRRLCRDKTFTGLCRSSAGYGSDHAFARRERFMYFCPCGLIRAVVPIIADGVYHGGVFLGQVRCDNAPDGTPNLERLLEGETGPGPRDRHFGELYDLTPTYDYAYLEYIADTVTTLINTIVARESERAAGAREKEAAARALEERIQRLERDLNVRKSSLAHWKTRVNLNFFINTLSSIASLAAIEDAPRVNEMCILFADHLRHYLTSERDFAPLRAEIEAVARYLAMQKIRFGESLEYSLHVAENAAPRQAPTMVFLPFVENAVLNGLALMDEPYAFFLDAAVDGEDVIITLRDNAPSLPVGLVPESPMPAQSGFDADSVVSSLSVAKFRLENLFGRRHKIAVSSGDAGTECVIRYSLLPIEGVR